MHSCCCESIKTEGERLVEQLKIIKIAIMLEMMDLLRFLRVLGLLALCGGVAPVSAEKYLSKNHGFAQSTYLIEVSQNTYLSRQANSLRNGGYETSEGKPVDFNAWYTPKLKETRVSWVTQWSPNLGLTWGFGSGERAEKYDIHPSFRGGFLLQVQPSRQSLLTFSAVSSWGGRMEEKTCVADYGDIGGIQAVNCRLAATALEPAETLKYLYNEKPSSYFQLGYQFNF